MKDKSTLYKLQYQTELEYVQLQPMAKSPEGSPCHSNYNLQELFISEMSSSVKECTKFVKFYKNQSSVTFGFQKRRNAISLPSGDLITKILLFRISVSGMYVSQMCLVITDLAVYTSK